MIQLSDLQLIIEELKKKHQTTIEENKERSNEIEVLKSSLLTYSSLVGNVSNTFSLVFEFTEKN